MPSLHRFILHPEYGESSTDKGDPSMPLQQVWYVQDVWFTAHVQIGSSSFSGLLPSSFPLEMLAGMDPAVYSAHCLFGYEELTSRSPRICWWYIYSANPLRRQSSRGLRKAELPGAERGTDPRARLRRGAAVLSWDQCIWPLHSELSAHYRSYHADRQTVLEVLLIFVSTAQGLRGNLFRLLCAFHTHIVRRVGC